MNAQDIATKNRLVEIILKINGAAGLHNAKRVAALSNMEGEIKRLEAGDDGKLSETVDLDVCRAEATAYAVAMNDADDAIDAFYQATLGTPPPPPEPANDTPAGAISPPIVDAQGQVAS